MKRRRIGFFALATSAVGVLASCNAILGNENEYRLAEDCASDCGGEGGGNQSGRGGTNAGNSNTNAGSSGQDGGRGASGGRGAVEAGANSGGQGGDEGGAAGGPGGPCVPAGREQCLNGIDDDCNGDVDCADAACDGPVACVPANGSAIPSTFPAAGQGCPTGYSPLALSRSLTAADECTGCTCVSPQTICTSGLYGYGTNVCGTQYMGLLYNVYTGRCDPMPADNDVYYFDIASFTECTAQGTASRRPATWGETRTLCVADAVGGGCPSGQRCAPSHTSASCTVTTGETTRCGAATPDDTGGVWYTGISDMRTCSACECPFNYGSGSCGSAYIQGFSALSCQGTAVSIGNGTPGSSCALPFAPVSGRIVGTPTGGSCQPRSSASGAATATGPRTVCCE